MTVPAVRLTDVGVRFGDVWALRHACEDIPSGSVVALVGTNGAGKTSLIRTLVGLDSPAEGTVEILGAVLDPRDPAHLARIGYVAQRKPLYGTFRVHEMLRYGRVTNPRWDAAFADRRIRDVGIDPKRRIDQLSGGQRTQVALTMALAKQPDLLVLDEPLADLDPLARDQVIGALMGEVLERGLTVVLSSHNLAELAEPCDRVIVLREGSVVLAGDTEELLPAYAVLTGPAAGLGHLARQGTVVDHESHGASVRVLVRLDVDDRFLDPHWNRQQAVLETVVRGHLQGRGLGDGSGPGLRAVP